PGPEAGRPPRPPGPAPRARARRRAAPPRHPSNWGGPEWPPKPPNRSSRPGEAVARLDRPTARRAPAKPWRASTPARSSRPGEAVARLDPRTLVAPRRSRGAPRPQPLVAPRRSRGAPRYCDRLLIRLFRVTLGGARRVGYHRRLIQPEFLHEAVRRIWGYDSFLPLHREA